MRSLSCTHRKTKILKSGLKVFSAGWQFAQSLLFWHTISRQYELRRLIKSINDCFNSIKCWPEGQNQETGLPLFTAWCEFYLTLFFLQGRPATNKTREGKKGLQSKVPGRPEKALYVRVLCVFPLHWGVNANYHAWSCLSHQSLTYGWVDETRQGSKRSENILVISRLYFTTQRMLVCKPTHLPRPGAFCINGRLDSKGTKHVWSFILLGMRKRKWCWKVIV